MAKLSRRGMLALGAGGAAVAGLGAAGYLASSTKTDLARAMLERMVGPFQMADAHLDAVIYTFEKAGSVPGGLKAGILAVAQSAPGGMAALSKAAGSRRFEALERGLLTTFVMTTNYLEVGAQPDGQILFEGSGAACSSPFAVLKDS